MEEIFGKIRKSPVEPLKMELDSKFKFDCHKGVSCFNKCCGDLDIFLTPYDIVRMKQRLGISSSEFLSVYTEPIIPERTLVPLIKLKMKEDGKCRFVNNETGCEIYSDRPVSCRYYPIGFGSIKSREVEGGDFYFMIKEDHCKGFSEERVWTVADFRRDQEIDCYDEINKDWVELIIQKKLLGSTVEPDEKSITMFFMGCYDVDSFREFIFESRFLDLFEIDTPTLAAIKDNDTELMKLGLKWLLFSLFREPSMKLKEGGKRHKSDHGHCGCSCGD